MKLFVVITLMPSHLILGAASFGAEVGAGAQVVSVGALVEAVCEAGVVDVLGRRCTGSESVVPVATG